MERYPSFLSMTLSEFESLALNERLRRVVYKGTPVARIKSNGRGFLLYAVCNFYVELEMTYTKTSCDVKALRSFVFSDRLDKYLAQISLETLGIGNAAA